MAFVARPLTEEEIKAIREYEGGQEAGRKQFSIASKRFKQIRAASSLEEALKFAGNKGQGNQVPAPQRGLPLSEVKAKQSPVSFQIKDEKVTLDPGDLYECYFLYQDLRTRHGIDNTFSDTLKAGIEYLWSLCHKPIIEGGEVKIA